MLRQPSCSWLPSKSWPRTVHAKAAFVHLYGVCHIMSAGTACEGHGVLPSRCSLRTCCRLCRKHSRRWRQQRNQNSRSLSNAAGWPP